MKVVDDLITLPVRRNQWGQYLVLPPKGDKPVGYVRATTIAKTLDEQSALVAWKARMVAIGLGKSPALVALAASADADDKKSLNDIAERAAEAGGATIRRDQGTALHAALEDSWHDPESSHEMFRPDVVAVHKALAAAGLTPVPGMFERMVVVDDLKIAGTFDLAVTDANGTIYVADVKTGGSLYGALGFAIQLAIYSRADAIYTQGKAKDGSEDVREPAPKFSQDTAYIFHVQPGSGHCDVLPLDLTVGAQGLAMAMEVRQIRKAKPLGKPLEATAVELAPVEAAAVALIKDVFPGATELVNDEWRAWMRGRLEAIIDQGHAVGIGAAWPDGVPTLKSGADITVEQAHLIEMAADAVEAKFTMPFPDEKPSDPVDPAAELGTWVSHITGTVDEGGDVDGSLVLHINDRARDMPVAGRALVAEILHAAIAAEMPVSLSGPYANPTVRRHAICTALLDLGDVVEDIPVALALISAATGRLIDADGLGQTVGRMSTTQAKRLSTLAKAVGDDIGVVYQMDGTVELTGDLNAVLSADVAA